MGSEVTLFGASKPAQERVCDHLGQWPGRQPGDGSVDISRLGCAAARVDLHTRVEGDRLVETAQRRRGEARERLAEAAAEAAPRVARHVTRGAVARDCDVVEVVAGLVDAE